MKSKPRLNSAASLKKAAAVTLQKAKALEITAQKPVRVVPAGFSGDMLKKLKGL